MNKGMKVLKTVMVSAALSAAMVSAAHAVELQGGGIVTASSALNFRSAPSESASIIDSLSNGYRVCILDIEGEWAHVTANGNPGYVNLAYLDKLDVMDVNGGGAKVTASTLNIRSKPSTEGEVLGQIPEGQVAEITGINKGWLQVKYNGMQGYVSPEYIEIVPGQASENSAGSSVITYAKQFIGTPYRYGGSSPSGFDCSGFTSYVYKHFGVNLSHSSSAQYGQVSKVSRGDLQAGDLVFFATRGRSIGHVGIYVGGGQFIHSPSAGSSVRIESMSSGYYANRFVGGGRVR